MLIALLSSLLTGMIKAVCLRNTLLDNSSLPALSSLEANHNLQIYQQQSLQPSGNWITTPANAQGIEQKLHPFSTIYVLQMA